ncbi:unnamed protein product [Medioppia subpectinata]|uniref:Poly [ADP-ribose] polymerase n=1 Tax=Medioppia subpectinata TaxID=1979941 RepID=A0A7R9KM16_9ACAR|nr:unnamed protein product [Medioppia subpectinata]CAG2105984.1 unnamed protein product [Medioppia subpectinata]
MLNAFLNIKIDYKSDAKKMCEQLDAEVIDTDSDKELDFVPNSLIGIDATYHRVKGLVILFTRWGRVGDTGQYQKTPFATVDEAADEFRKIFRAKTGNHWQTGFAAQPKKYRLVELQKRRRRRAREYKFDSLSKAIVDKRGDGQEESVEAKLPAPLQKLMKTLIRVHTGGDSYRSLATGRESAHHKPFGGLLSDESLTKAEDVLTRMEALVVQRDGIKDQQHSDDYLRVTGELVDLSEQFYHLIPVFGYQYEKLKPLFTRQELRDKQELYEKLKPLFTRQELRDKQELVHNLIHFEFASELLLAAQCRLPDVHPCDYVYKALGCHLQLLEAQADDDECQLILQYVHNTTQSTGKRAVKGIYRINRSGEDKRLTGTDRLADSNRWLLWHGTRAGNVLSILAKGLQKGPLGSQISGHLFGKGVYLADMFTKSQAYCYGTSDKFMLLCEVSLGEVQEVRISDLADDKPLTLANDKHSLKTSHARYIPDPQSTVYWKGRAVPLGEPIPQEFADKEYNDVNYNEYIVFNSEQICLRYLIHYKD